MNVGKPGLPVLKVSALWGGLWYASSFATLHLLLGATMGNDAGFAAAVTIRQSLLQDTLRATYANGAFPSLLDFPLPGGPQDVSVLFYVGEPDIACKGTNLLVITVPVWGGVTVKVTQADAVTVQVKGSIEVTIVPDFRLNTAADMTKSATLYQLATIAVPTWTATVTSADTPADIAIYVTGDMFRARLETAITYAVEFGKISLPQIPVDYLHGIPAFVDPTSVASVAVEGALLLGFSSRRAGTTEALSGDVTALSDFAGSFDLAAFINPLAAPLFFSDIKDALISAGSSAGATLDTDTLSITLAEGHAHVKGTMEATGGNLNFSFDVIPNMADYLGPGGEWVAYTKEHWVDNPRERIVNPRSWPALWFTTGNAQSDVDASWWVTALEVLTVGYLLLYVLPKFSNAEGSFDNQINDHPPTAPYPRVQRSSAPVGGIVLRTALDSFVMNSEGISVGVHVNAKPTTIAVSGPAIIPSNYVNHVLHYSLRLPSGALRSDPTLRVAWTLKDVASGAVLASQDDPVTMQSPKFEFMPSSFAPSTQFTIEGRLHRLFGIDSVDIGTAETSLQVRGALVPGAYVRWRAQSVKPAVGFNATTGLWEYGGDAHVKRTSKWHRTDAPCEAASKGINYAGRYQPKFADTLHFPLDKLEQFRPTLCDYCFFGGPAGANARF